MPTAPRAPLDVKVTFLVPAESKQRDFPRFEGEGRAREVQGRLVLEGNVFRLSAWWLKVGAPIGLLAAAGLYSLTNHMLGLWVGLGGVLAIVAADVWQQRTGRAYALEVPTGCGYRMDYLGGRCRMRIQLDRFVVGAGRRPPLVELEVDAEDARAIDRFLASAHASSSRRA